MESAKVSKKLLKRLPIYLNYLKGLPEDSANISATALAKALELGDVQVRKDLAKISAAGRRRTGRSREQLIRDIEDFLDFASETCTIVVGAGKLGQALLDYEGFEEAGFHVMAGFDLEPEKESTNCGKPIYPISYLDRFCRYYNVHIGVIAVPAKNAQKVCNILVSNGVKAIWNFAPIHLKVPEDVVVHSENLAISLTSLRVQMKKQDLESITKIS